MNMWTIWTIKLVIFFGLYTNVKFKVIFKINIVNLKIIHVVIDFNGYHHKFFG
jgi:hypothetical protein